MPDSRERLIARLATVLAGLSDVEPAASRLCEAARSVLDADGAAVTLRLPSGDKIVVAATDDLARALETAQVEAGEGPSVDALDDDAMQVADFTQRPGGRWPSVREQADALGFRGRVVAMPLRAGTDPIGTLTVHRGDQRFGVDPATSDALGLAIGTALLQDPRLGLRGQVFAEVWPVRAQIHQATGMIMSQVGVRAEDALALLQGHAFARRTTLVDAAQRVIERDISFRHLTVEGR